MNGDITKRGRPRRIWVKLHCDGILRGSINYQLELEEQAVWMKMLAFTAVCGGQDGWIQDNDMRPLPHFFIANELHCPLEVFKSTLKKCNEEGRCKENSQGIQIVNWAYYQSEYSRQKPYREKKARATIDESLGEVAKAYEENIGELTPVIAEQLKDLCENYDVEAIKAAIKVACNANVRKMSYIIAVLEKRGSGKGLRAEKIDPNKFIQGKYGHTVARTKEDLDKRAKLRKERQGK